MPTAPQDPGAVAVVADPRETHDARTLIEAMLDDLVQAQDPWGYLNTIDDQRIDPRERQNFYQNFITMIANRPPSEQDALISAGQSIFRYRVDTARRDAGAIRETTQGTTKVVPFVAGPDFLAEIIRVPDSTPPVRFLLYREDGTSEVVDRVQVGDVTYVPPQSKLVEDGVILLPTGIEEYVDHVSLFREVRHFIGTYLYIEDSRFRNIIAYYIFLTWVFDRFDVVPYLRAQGEFGAGKTRLLQTVGALTYRTTLAGGATTAAPIFRIIERFKGTLIIDEADFSESDLWSEIVKILNVGYMKGFPVLRAERGGPNDGFDVKGYDCYAPKVLSTRKRFSDQALESRCLSYTMQSVMVPRSIPFITGDEFRAEAQVLRNKLLLWRFRTYRSVSIDPRERIEGLDARLNQILLPLLASTTDPVMRASILAHAQMYQSTLREDRRESFEGLVAFALLQRYRHRKGAQVLMKEVTDQLRLDYGDNIKIDPRRVGDLVRHTFGLSTVNRGGTTWVNMSDIDRNRLAIRYHIPLESVMGVAELNGRPPATTRRTPVPTGVV